MASYPQLNRNQLHIRPLAERRNLLRIESIAVHPDSAPPADEEAEAAAREIAPRILASRRKGRPVVMAYGAHLIKNGLAPVVIELLERGWITHLATNGAGVIHDWEFAFQGESSEDVRANVAQGAFGVWEETGRYINLAVLVGAWRGMGYGQSVGAMVEHEALVTPTEEELNSRLASALARDCPSGRVGAAADLWEQIRAQRLQPGKLRIPHPWKSYSLTGAAFRVGAPLTVHPGIGYDIIYTHPLNHGGAIGRAALSDFLAFAHAVRRLRGGVYLSVGSAIMSPMIFEKAMSMAQNLALQAGERIEDHFIVVNDIQPGEWDWSAGEPPKDHPAYYLRFCKSFSRMGGEMRYVCADNRAFLRHLLAALRRAASG